MLPSGTSSSAEGSLHNIENSLIPSIDSLSRDWSASGDPFVWQEYENLDALEHGDIPSLRTVSEPYEIANFPCPTYLASSMESCRSVDLNGFSNFPIPSEPNFSMFNGSDGTGLNDLIVSKTSEHQGKENLPRLNFPQLTDLSSFFITTWFTHICPMWSAFDSDMNLNRVIALEALSNNEPMFYSLQSMAACYMVESMPHLASMAKISRQHAAQAIKREMSPCLSAREFERVPVGLVLSLICLGTSLCWSDSKQIGSHFLRQTKTLLQHLNRFSLTLPQKERQGLSFLNNSCFYWDMLCRVVGKEEDIGPRWQIYRDPDPLPSSVPRPWTGVSASAQRLFASAITLCRRFHSREKRAHKVTGSSLRESLQDIDQATRLEQQIVLFRVPGLSDTAITGDISTPSAHLLSVAEAYRLSALLQLYETFEDLGTVDDFDSEEAAGPEEFHASECSRRLMTTFNLLQTLEHIPPNSGSRSIQPMLYVTASTGLRLRCLPSKESSELNPFDEPISIESAGLTQSLSATSLTNWPFLEQDMSLTTDFKISQARHFIMTRLGLLEKSLPSRPIRVAKDLTKEIWNSYDA
ncbi:fungal-specific transcription factor domain-containing protein [Penicillium angulare]|uniref:Fungal-specific transcription factor domain-containing protein n=1 Tax=Penicillium angulare TaxID=116970 RepID=A0A9W9FWZ1_9EURO|nr:fungal-specific transcription factor domain-containing protein [Penicillium angulare]